MMIPDDRILFGAAYYAEYQLEDRIDLDLDLMRDAGFTVIRVGESVWSTWEPRDGEFELDWLQPVLDGAHARGIGVILGTPTYAIPPWLQVKHPELAGETATGVRMPWGSRQEVDYSSPTFRRYAERVIRAVVGRYATHPAVIGYQVDNEPGALLFHNDGAFEGFVARLRERYGTPDALNREWGLTYWSHRIDQWSELWRPDGNSLPQYDLAWREYQADITTDFIAWQADIVREYASSGQFVTTCLAYPRAAFHDQHLAAALDVTAGNPYYQLQDGLDLEREVARYQLWATSGVWSLLLHGDRMFSSRQERYLVTETGATSIGGPEQNHPPYPGQLLQAALALVARGATMIEYWHWHTLHFGTETYWGGILPHSQVPGRIYDEIRGIGGILGELGPALAGYEPDADISLLYSTRSKWALEFSPPLRTAEHQRDRQSYAAIFGAFYRGVLESGRQAHIAHDEQFAAADPAQFAAEHPVLIVPAYYAAEDDVLRRLAGYAAAGGHLVITPKTAYADHEARARAEVAPPGLADAAGVHYEEYSNIDHDRAVTGTDALPLSPGAVGTRWIDGLISDGAEVLAGYDDPDFGRFAAITSAATGSGRITTVGTIPGPVLAADLCRWLAPEPSSGWVQVPGTTVSSGRVADGSRVVFLHNWTGRQRDVPAAESAEDLLGGGPIGAGDVLHLEPRGVRVVRTPTTGRQER